MSSANTSRRIKRVWLDESQNECTMCGACEASCPEVFEVPEKMVIVDKPNYSLVDVIIDTAEHCPVKTIAIEFTS
jgi:ferredoxin